MAGTTARDLKLSRKMQKLIRKTEELVEKEMGQSMGVAIIVFPWSEPGKEGELAPAQYASNAPRSFMQGFLDTLVKGWKQGHEDTPLHERN